MTHTEFDALSDFAVGAILRSSLSTFGRNFGRFVVLAALFLFPNLIVSLAMTRIAMSGGEPPTILRYWSFAGAALQALAQVAIITAAFDGLSGRPVRIAKALSEARGYYASGLGLAIIQEVGFVLGAVLLLVPGLFLATVWYVGRSVLVFERKGIVASLRRSADLTRGHRWAVFGIFLLQVLGLSVVILILTRVALVFDGVIASAVASFAGEVILMPLGTIIGTATYCALRRAKEGPAVETFAEVFA